MISNSLVFLVLIFVLVGNNKFVNGDHLAAYLLMPIVYSFVYNDKYIYRIINIFLIVLIFILTDSRSFLLSSILSITIFSIHKRNKFEQVILIFICFVSLIISLWIKFDSLIARKLIWSLTLKEIIKKPFLGFGYGRFKIEYNNFQLALFKSGNPEYIDTFYNIAGNVHHAHNELIQIIFENGIIFLIMILLIIYKSISLKYSNFVFPIIALLIFSLFSFPIHILPIALLSMLFFIPLIKINDLEFNKFLPFFLIIFLSIINTNYLLFQTKWMDVVNSNMSFLEKQEHFINLENNLFSKFDGKFYFVYSKILFENNDYVGSKNKMEYSQLFFTDFEQNNHLGSLFYKLGQIELAEKNYYNAHYMYPSKLEPLYNLFVLYYNTQDFVNAKNLSDIILQREEKIKTQKSVYYKNQIKEMINKIRVKDNLREFKNQ